MKPILVMGADGMLRLEYRITKKELKRQYLRLAMLCELGTPKPKATNAT